MNVYYIIQYIVSTSFILLFILLLLKRKDAKKYIPVGLFSIVYADAWCYFADYFKLWNYPTRLFPKLSVASIPFNYLVLPVLVMIWIMYCPRGVKGKIKWAFLWSFPIVCIEFIITRYTDILDYTNGFDVHISFVLWLISWYIFLKFHTWINS